MPPGVPAPPHAPTPFPQRRFRRRHHRGRLVSDLVARRDRPQGQFPGEVPA
ncbi:hypothetical protein GA0115246_105661, partial [Streptomyces sp. SolWspMP-sol7th]